MLSVPATLLFPPKLMLKLCVPFCLLISSAVAVSAAADRDLFYVLCFVYGTSIAWQFGSMYSWLAAHMDLVGARNAVFSLGCGSASLAPLAAGYLFTHVGPMSIWRFNLGLAVVQVGLDNSNFRFSNVYHDADYQHHDDEILHSTSIVCVDIKEVNVPSPPIYPGCDSGLPGSRVSEKREFFWRADKSGRRRQV